MNVHPFPWLRRAHARPRHAAVCGALVALILLAFAGSALAAPVQDPERNSTNPTGWYWQTGVSVTALSDLVNNQNQRIVDLRVDQASPLTFTAATVTNTGAYQRGWWWYVGQSVAQVSSQLQAHNARLIDLDTYVDNGVRKYAAVMVSNTGDAQKGWWWYVNETTSQISAQLSANNARVVDLEPVGNGTYDVIMIANTGVDQSGWWWYVRQTPAQIASNLSTNHARLIDLVPDANGTFDAVMVQSSSAAWWWYYGETLSQLSQQASQNGARIFDVERYSTPGGTRWAALMIDNSDPETGRLRGIMANGLSSGSYGVYLKRVGSSKVFAGLQQSKIFEPASALKALVHLYAMRQVELRNANLDTTNVTYHYDPSQPSNKDICPSDASAPSTATTTLRDADQRMMGVSDNRMTRAIIDHFGQANINAYAAANGFSDTQIRQIFGCGFQNNLRNDWTLVDAGKLYEGVLDGSLLNDSTTFFSVMNQGGADAALTNIINQEAAKQGKSAIASKFAKKVYLHAKGGSYDICFSGGCNTGYSYFRSQGEEIALPYKANGVVVLRHFVGGFWANDVQINCAWPGGSSCSQLTAANSAISTVADEQYRSAVAAALKTW